MTQVRFSSIEDIRVYRHELSERRPDDDPVVKTWRAASRVIWAALLAGSFAIYYFSAVMTEAIGLPHVVISVPATPAGLVTRPSVFL